MHWSTQPLFQRNIEIMTQVLRGQTCRAVATKYQLSTTRVAQIVEDTCRRMNPQMYWRLADKRLRKYCQLLPALRDYRHAFGVEGRPAP